MKKSKPYDLNPIGKVLLKEDRTRDKLKAIQQEKIASNLPSVDAVVKNIKDKYRVDQRIVFESQPLKTIEIGCEILSPSQERVKTQSRKKTQKGQWNRNLNIPYYRKVNKKHMYELKNEMEILHGSPSNQFQMKNSQSVSSLHQDHPIQISSNVFLPPIFSPKTHAISLIDNFQKTSNQDLKNELYFQKAKLRLLQKERAKYHQQEQSQLSESKMQVLITNEKNKLRQDSIETIKIQEDKNQDLNSTQVIQSTNGNNNRVKFLSVLTYDNPLEIQSHKKVILDYQKFKSTKAKKMIGEIQQSIKGFDYHLGEQSTLQIGSSNNTNQHSPKIKILEVNSGSQTSQILSEKKKMKRKLRNKSGINLAVIKFNEKKGKDRYNDMYATYGKNQGLMKDCLIITQQNENSKLMTAGTAINTVTSGDHTQVPSQQTGVRMKKKSYPKAEELLKQLKL